MVFTEQQLGLLINRIAEFAAPYRSDSLFPNMGRYIGRRVRNRAETFNALQSAACSLAGLFGNFAFARAGAEQAGYNEICVRLLKKYTRRGDQNFWKDYPDWQAFHDAFIEGCEHDEIGSNRKINSGLIRDLYRLARSTPENGLFHVWAKEIRSKRSIIKLHGMLDNIHGIGRKIASFICRDTVYLADLEANVPPCEMNLLQPVDVWIRRIAEFLNPRITLGRDDEAVIAEFLAEMCSKFSVSGVAFNQGGWYLATHQAGSQEERLRKILLTFVEGH